MSEHTPLTEAERDELTEKEKALRDWLRGQPNGAEWWFVIRAGFQRSYNLGLQDAARTSTATADTGLRERVEALAEELAAAEIADLRDHHAAEVFALLDATAAPTTDAEEA